MDIRFLGHAAFELADAHTRLLLDPFLTGNPKAAATPDQLDPSVIMLTHGHGDHLGDTVEIAKRSGAPVVAVVELASEIAQSGVQTFDPNLGGTVNFGWGWVKLVPAWHTSKTPQGTVNTPAGLLIKFANKLIYHLGDTCLFSDMRLVSPPGEKIDVALVPIGGHYTMDRFDAVRAVELIDPSTVVPMHYNTFPLIEADADAFQADTQSKIDTRVIVLQPGETLQL